MRLIDADEIIDSLGGSDMDFAIGAVIDEQPTVFDVDKVVEQLDDEANINQHICIMRPDLDMINPQFLMYQIQSTRIQNLIDMVEGASREGLTNVVLKN